MGQNYRYNRVLKGLFLAVGGSFIFFFTCALFVNSSRLKNQAAHELSELLTSIGFDGTQVKINDAKWGGIFKPLSLRLNHIAVSSPRLTCQADKLTLGLDITNLLKGQIHLNKISLKNLVIQQKGKTIARLGLHLNRWETGGDITIDHGYVNPQDLTPMHPQMAALFTGIDMPLTLTGTMRVENDQLTEGELTLKTQGQGGMITILPFYPEPLSLHKGRINVQIKDNSFFIKNIHLSHGQTTADLHGKITLGKNISHLKTQGGLIDVDLQGEAINVPVDHLSILWPQGLAKNARQWVISNLSCGSAKRATLNLSGQLIVQSAALVALSPHRMDFRLLHLLGDIDADNVTVHYTEGLPVVTGATGKCHYTQNQFDIEAHGMVNGLVLNRGKISIFDFDKEDQTITLQLEIAGPVEKALDIIARKPLKLTQTLGINHKMFTGSSLTTVDLKFPLITNVALNSIQVEARSKIYNGAITSEAAIFDESNPFKGKLLEQATFDLLVNNHQLELSGNAHILTHSSEVQWIEKFHPPAHEDQSSWKIIAHLDFDPPEVLSPMIKGQTDCVITRTLKKDSTGTLSIEADLENVSINIPYLLLRNDKGSPLYFKLHSTFNKQKEYHFKDAKLSGEDMMVQSSGSITLNELDNLKNIHIHLNKFGNLEGGLTISGSYQKPKITGKLKHLDLERILADPNLFNPDDPLNLNCSLNLEIEQVLLGNDFTLQDITCQLHWTDRQLQSAHIFSKIPEVFELIMAPPKKTSRGLVQSFSLTSHNAGDLFDSFSPNNDIKGGVMNVVGQRITVSPQELITEAELDVRDVLVKKAPFLAQLLSAASLEGLINTLSGSGIGFDQCTGKIKWKKDEIVLHNIHFSGGSIGLHVQGKVNRLTDNIDLKGELYPFNGLNYLIANIPLVGSILSGGNNKGVFSTAFKAHGKIDAPTILVNPLTTITPGGVLRVMKEVTKPRSSGSEAVVSPGELTAENGDKSERKPHWPSH